MSDPDLTVYNGAFRSPSKINALLRRAQDECHLVTPASSCAALIDGWDVHFSGFFVDISHETYAVTGDDDDEDKDQRRGLSRTALDRIALAAAVDWTPECHRFDNGSAPYYCHYIAVGKHTLFDTAEKTIRDEKIIDLREGSAYVNELHEQGRLRHERAKANHWRYVPPPNGDRRIQHERVHLLSYAVTKAMNRAIRRLGVRIWYTRDELERKPFVVARPYFTGRTADPALRREFALMIAKDRMTSSRALYGESAKQTEMPQFMPGTAEPPPVDATPADTDDVCDYCGTTENVECVQTPKGPVFYCHGERCSELANACVEREHQPERSYPTQRGATPRVPAGAGATPPAEPQTLPQRPAGGERKPLAKTGLHIPKGGPPIEDADDHTLRTWVDITARRLSTGQTPAQFRAADKELLHAMKAELARRERGDAARDPLPQGWR